MGSSNGGIALHLGRQRSRSSSMRRGCNGTLPHLGGGSVSAWRGRVVQGLLSSLWTWIGLSKPSPVGNASDCDRSESMSAMPHARQMEQVLESLAAGKTVNGAQELQPQWRLVSRDGSTSSLSGLPEDKPHDCPDCLAGRCGQNSQGCKCSGGGDQTTISLDRLTGTKTARSQPDTAPGSTLNAAMPPAKPQLFEKASTQSPTSILETSPPERGTFFAQASSVNVDAEISSDAAPLANARPATASPLSLSADGELQQVVNEWPRLPLSTRRAIMAIVGASREADSA